MKREEGRTNERPRINFRPLVCCALGLIFGIELYFAIRFGGVRPSDFCIFLILFSLCLVPFERRRVLALALALLLFGGLGAGLAHLNTEQRLRVKPDGEYLVSGMVGTFTVKNGRTDVLLRDLTFDGVPVGGELTTSLTGETFRAGDIVTFQAKVTANGLPMSGDSDSIYLFCNGIRYRVGRAEAEKTGTSGNVLLLSTSALYDSLRSGMGGTEAQIAYALLTGNSHGIDTGLLEEVRAGGIAHIFAVSGLHIGTLFAAVMLLFRKLGRRAYFPALAAAFVYAAFCAFTVSSVRALVMCAVLGAYRSMGRKYDYPSALALAAILILLVSPCEWLATGFRLSFGACLGIALLGGPLKRCLCRIPHLPRLFARYLSANLAVQFFTVPILLEAFGYFSVWGFLFNIAFIPLLPVFFLTTLLFSALALAIPPAAAFFYAAPKGLLSLFVFLFSAADLSWVLTGFSLGMGASVFVIALVMLSDRIRLSNAVRAGIAACLVAVFAAIVVLENVVFTGCRIDVYTKDDGAAALVRSPHAAVLVIDGDLGLADAKDFLARTYGGKLDGVLVLAEDETEAINRAAFLPAAAVYARDAVETGLRETALVFGERVEIGGLVFRFARRDKLAILAEGTVLELDFENPAALGADFFLDSSDGGLKFFLENGIMRTWPR